MLIAAHFGGTRNPMAVRWPKKIKPDAVPRPQFHDVNESAPTIYDAAGITPPQVVNGFQQPPIQGVSMAYIFDDADADGRLLTQYFEIMGSRGVYHKSWSANAFGPRSPWLPGLPKGFLTMYNGKQAFADNPISRYAIGDRDKMKFDDDGSLTNYIQRESPGKDKESNWLPAPKSVGFSMNMRLYCPKPEALDETWKPPAVRRVPE